jgi:hypothetical protein
VIKLKIAFKWAAYASLGIFVYAFATEIPVLAYAIGAILGGLIVRELVKDAVGKVLLEERRELQERGFATVDRIEDIDRKVSAIWDRIRAISGN